MNSYIEHLKHNALIIKLIKDMYSKPSILKSCYKYTDNNYIFIDSIEKEYIIYFQPKEKSNIENNIEKEFLNELLDQELRTEILKETKKIRDTIVNRALLSGQSNDSRI